MGREEMTYTIKSSEETNSGVSFVVCSTDNPEEKPFSLRVDRAIRPELLKILEPNTKIWINDNSDEIFIITGDTKRRLSDLVVEIEMKHEIDPDKTYVNHAPKRNKQE